MASAADAIATLADFFGWTDVGLGRKRAACRKCSTQLELRLMDDLLEVACPGCGASPFFERAEALERAYGAQGLGRILKRLGILTDSEVAAASGRLTIAGAKAALEAATRERRATGRGRAGRAAAAAAEPLEAPPEAEAGGAGAAPMRFIDAAREIGLFSKNLFLAVLVDAAPPGFRYVARPLRGLITKELLLEAAEAERTEGTPVGQAVAALVERAQKDLLLATCERSRGPERGFDLDHMPLSPEILETLPPSVAAQYLAIPVGLEGDTLVVALRDPLDFEAIDSLKFVLGREVKAIPASEDALFRTLERAYPGEDARDGALPAEIRDELALLADGEPGPGAGAAAGVGAAEDEDEEEDDAAFPEEPPGVRALNLLVLQAVEERADQLVVEPLEDGFRARLRRGPRLREASRLPKAVGDAVVERAMVLAGMDLARRETPQRGSMRLTIAGENMELQAATVPASFGTALAVALRVAAFRPIALDAIGLVPGDPQVLRSLLSLPPGLVLVAAPPGEGKTTLLYALLREVDRAVESVLGLERAVRLKVEGATQLAGPDYSTFAGAAETFRPDRVFIDDLLAGLGPLASRDEARLALDLGLAGARVVATVGAPDVAAAAARLVAAGIDPDLLASGLSALVGIRLVRRVCGRCREEYEPPHGQAAELGLSESAFPRRLSLGVGCWECGGTGYAGRAALVEVFPAAGPVAAALRRGPDIARVRRRAAHAGHRTIPEKALAALRSGLITVSQLDPLRVGARR